MGTSRLLASAGGHCGSDRHFPSCCCTTAGESHSRGDGSSFRNRSNHLIDSCKKPSRPTASGSLDGFTWPYCPVHIRLGPVSVRYTSRKLSGFVFRSRNPCDHKTGTSLPLAASIKFLSCQ